MVQLTGTFKDNRVQLPDHFRAKQMLKHINDGIVEMPLEH